ALEAAREAVSLYRALAASRPDAFTPDLAGSLNNLASFLSDLGQREAALEAAREAVSLYRALAASRPDAFTPDLAASLNNLALRLSALGQREAALEAAREAVERLGPFFLRLPAAFAGWMEPMLRHYFELAGALGREPDLACLPDILAAWQRWQSARSDDQGETP
ncbi:tetratricopeptide repeat protein, partial [Plasticicumulans lactativorans]